MKQANAIMFSVATGNDGVRDDSGVLATIFDGAGLRIQTFQLKEKNGPAWGRSNTIDISIFALDQDLAVNEPAGRHIAYIQLTLEQGNGFGETTDHWDVAGVSVAVISGPVSIVAGDGFPKTGIIAGTSSVERIATQGLVFGVGTDFPLATLGDKANLAFSGPPGISVF